MRSTSPPRSQQIPLSYDMVVTSGVTSGTAETWIYQHNSSVGGFLSRLTSSRDGTGCVPGGPDAAPGTIFGAPPSLLTAKNNRGGAAAPPELPPHSLRTLVQAPPSCRLGKLDPPQHRSLSEMLPETLVLFIEAMKHCLHLRVVRIR